jgi:transposase-like protein
MTDYLCHMELDFEQLKALQYCDNEQCPHLNQIGVGNICILSRKNNQVYCNACKNRWVLTKETFFFDLRTRPELIISVLKDLSEGKGQRAIQRTTGVNLTTQKRWLLRAAAHMIQISDYLEKDMRLDRVQIDEFWSFVLKKRDYYGRTKIG